MSLAADTPISTPAMKGAWLVRAIAVVLALAMLLYGVVAIDTGIVNYKGAGNAEVAAKRIEMQRAAEAGDSSGSAAEHSGIGFDFLRKHSSPQYSFGKDGLSEPAIHYALMPKFNGITLSIHNALGGVCMLFGALQFWPAFRRRFPLWHRAFGGLYILAAQSAMIAAMIYLSRTAVVDIYDHLTFYVGLWALAIGVTVTLWMAIYSMLQKRIAQHQAFMCLNFGLLLTAPIQRYGWLAFGMFGPQDMRQLEGNYAVTGVLVPLTVMIGYGLFTINRWLQADRSAASAQKVAQPFGLYASAGRLLAMLSPLVLLAAGATTVQHYLLQPGLQHIEHAAQWIPAGVIQLEDQVIVAQAATRQLFTIATLLGLIAGAHLMWTAFVAKASPARYMGLSGWALAAAGGAVGAVLVQWGVQMGLPSFATLAGGAIYLFGGSVTLLLSALLAFALVTKRHVWVKEWGVFVIACLVATPSFYWALPLIGAQPIDPQFVQEGHVFRMASYGEWMLLMGAFVYALFSEATHSKLAR
ncbi:MAG: DUF2306 domain-containing protein [Aquabacterium sp.]|uniref:DUF2306 domain-containing protein n=1 Tax=Aquabacterium sp. TaxID=1872578 RepID=UPI0025C2A6A7|nr:DUF2306 domain-containing protein [Aquabacterium sp.]MBI5924774.1 DUF2306 domain-containing protein [Aquabacterium sp.]